MLDIILLTNLPDSPYLDAVISLYIQAFTGPPRYEQWDRKSVEALLTEHARHGCQTCLACSGEEVLGFAIFLPLAAWPVSAELQELGIPYTPQSYYLSSIAVAESARGRGIGDLLVRSGEKLAQEAGLSTMVARCREDAPAIQALLRRRGYRLAASYTAEMGGSTAPRLVFVRDLGSAPP